jgi:hypothetical protein
MAQMNKIQIQAIIQDMRDRITNLQVTIMKMEQSGKFEPDDPRFDKLHSQIYDMEMQMSKLGIMIGERPYRMEGSVLDKPKKDRK